MNFKQKHSSKSFLTIISFLFVYLLEISNMDVNMSENNKFTNRLTNETSPYLLEHADNPVNWNPWDEEALLLAKKENKPIFLSIGYSACHWCHVMEELCFRNESIASLLNDNFISIKVDREERPDLDQIYMDFVHMTTGSGGWPMSVFITPDLKPFYGGTYFPPENFSNLLTEIVKSWKSNKRYEINDYALNVTNILNSISSSKSNIETFDIINKNVFNEAIKNAIDNFDTKNGGFGKAPKFPPSALLSFLIKSYSKTKNKNLYDIIFITLTKMASSGMYDHVYGGFHRYSVDEEWKVPHFEKMLYDNALLSKVYFEAFQVIGTPFLKKIGENILDFILMNMTDVNGGFYSSFNADSEKKEGIFYLWKEKDLKKYLNDSNDELFFRYFTILQNGNFTSLEKYHENLNILHSPISFVEFCKIENISEERTWDKLQSSYSKLRSERKKRIAPSLDDKVLTAWNALMISGFAKGYQVTHNTKYLDAATKSIDFILNNLKTKNTLLRTYSKGTQKYSAYLPDYACLIQALLDVYECNYNLIYLQHAYNLCNEMIDNFWDTKDNGFYFSQNSSKDLIVRNKDSYDSEIPSGNSIATLCMIKLSKLYDNKMFLNTAKNNLKYFKDKIEKNPFAYYNFLNAVDFLLNPGFEIVITGKNTSPFIKKIHENYQGNNIVVSTNEQTISKDTKNLPFLLTNKSIEEKPTIYLCKNNVCKQPIYDIDDLNTSLGLN